MLSGSPGCCVFTRIGEIGFDHDIGGGVDERCVHAPCGEYGFDLFAKKFDGDVSHCLELPYRVNHQGTKTPRALHVSAMPFCLLVAMTGDFLGASVPWWFNLF